MGLFSGPFNSSQSPVSPAMDRNEASDPVKRIWNEERPEYRGVLARKGEELKTEQMVYEKLRDFEGEAFVNSLGGADQKSSSEDAARRRKKLGINDRMCFKRISQEDLDSDLAKLRTVLGGPGTCAKAENRVFKTKNGSFKKNDRVRVTTSTTVENAVVCWVNSTDITFRRSDGSKFKCAISEIQNGGVKITRVRMS